RAQRYRADLERASARQRAPRCRPGGRGRGCVGHADPRDGARSDPARSRGDRSGQAQGRAAARHQSEDALQQAGEVRHPGGEVSASDLMHDPSPSGAARKLPAELARLLHDLRGPLNSAVMHLEVLKRTVAEDPASADSLRTVLQQLARLSDMLPAAFSVAALEATVPAPVSLKALVDRARQQPGLEAVTVADATWPDVEGDSALLELAIVHLLRNATEATPAGARPPEVSAAVE